MGSNKVIFAIALPPEFAEETRCVAAIILNGASQIDRARGIQVVEKITLCYTGYL